MPLLRLTYRCLFLVLLTCRPRVVSSSAFIAISAIGFKHRRYVPTAERGVDELVEGEKRRSRAGTRQGWLRYTLLSDTHTHRGRFERERERERSLERGRFERGRDRFQREGGGGGRREGESIRFVSLRER